MNPDHYVTALAERLLPGDRSDGSAALLVDLVRELAKARPVSPTILATTLGWPVARIKAALESGSGTEYDDEGNIVGYGVSLRETPHILEVDGRRLYTWCALDTLMFPALIGRTACVSSSCAESRVPVSLTVTPTEIRDVTPADAVVSLIVPQSTAPVRQSFCCHVHFFASVGTAKVWASRHQGVEIVRVREAFGLGQQLARYLLEAADREKRDWTASVASSSVASGTRCAH